MDDAMKREIIAKVLDQIMSVMDEQDGQRMSPKPASPGNTDEACPDCGCDPCCCESSEGMPEEKGSDEERLKKLATARG